MDVEKLKRDCGQMLANNGINPKHKTGKLMIYAFWVGVLKLNGGDHGYVTVCIMSGRFDDLVEMPK